MNNASIYHDSCWCRVYTELQLLGQVAVQQVMVQLNYKRIGIVIICHKSMFFVQ